ncbi:M1 family peptidase [Corallococcus sp. H22C18031201]|uniref:M1 family metallopeptidase n=1 Tax=Citreicoccus inhibens TaxID=2849499 RepID=UPI000E71034D|nr:M1 family metallopeptidase [Citreicoccus inhibens]MBU8896761.1 M1 family metallopeptidase [Citreicoccus inhibens]RJS21942.1 M1 family peptidase [Corallococcus sp. H22C18031201]
MPNLFRRTALAAVTLLAACSGSRALAPDAPTSSREAAASAPKATPTAPTLRLPEDVKPTGYRVELAMDPKAPTFQGSVDIDLAVLKPTSVVWLNGTALEVKQATLVQGGKPVGVTPVVGGKDFLGFVLEAPLSMGSAHLRVEYTGTASEREVSGAFRVNEDGDWYVYTQFEPLGARRAFPTFDEPGFKVPWELSLRVPEGNVAVTNTPEVSREPGADHTVTFHFARTQPLPSYLIAFGVGPFDFAPAADSGQKKVKTRIITPKGRAGEAAYAAEMTPRIIEQLETYFGSPYAYEKLDVMAVPLMGGAMENPGLVTFNSRLILSKPEEDTMRRQRSFVGVQVHELAHQWFGDLVTMAWWDDLWLNESFASWMEARILGTWQPTWDETVKRVGERSYALKEDGLLSARRIRQPIESNDDVVNAFDGITYGKGSAVLAMTEAWLGEDVFRRGIQRHLRAHAGGNATAKDFLAAMSAEAGKDVGAVMDTFLDQGGAPTVSVELECGGGQPRVLLSQSRYLPLGSMRPAPQQWKVPVCVKYAAGDKVARACTVLEQEHAELALPESKGCPAWVFPNAEGAGYFRMQLSQDLRAKLMKTGYARLSRLERVALLGDALALVEAGALPAAEALPLLEQAAKDPDRQIFEAGLELLSLVEPSLLADGRREDVQRYMRDLFSARARKLGFTPRAGESEDTRLLRPIVVRLAGSSGADAQLVTEASALAAKWLTDRRAVAPEMVEPALDIAVKRGTAAFHAQLLSALRQEKDRRNRQVMLGALGHTVDPDRVRANLSLIVDKEQDPRETMWLLLGASRDTRTQDLAFDFVKTHYDELAGANGKAALLPEEFIPHLVYIGSSYCDAGKRAQFAQFFTERNAKVSGGSRELAKVLESVDQCIALKQAQGASLESFFAGRAAKAPKAPVAR